MESTEKRFIHISPSSLDDLEFCLRYFNWRQWRLPGSSQRLDEGTVFHKILEFYYKAMGIVLPIDECVEIAVTEARAFYAEKPEIDVEILERMIEIFHEYVEHYGSSDWDVYMHNGEPAVELPNSGVLFENDKLCIVFECITDLMIVKPNGPEPVDHKTRAANVMPTLLTNQFLGTLWLHKAEQMWYNAIGMQKSVPADGRFHRYPVGFAQSVITEWRESVIYNVVKLLESESSGYIPPNHKMCWNCVFEKRICQYPADSREALLATQFVQRPPKNMYER